MGSISKACEVAAAALLAMALPVAASAESPVTTDTTEPALADAHLTVEPSIGLADGQAVQVMVSGFVSHGEVGLIQCMTTGSGLTDLACGPYHPYEADRDGVLRTEFVVHQAFHDDQTGADVDCLQQQCWIGSGEPSGAFPTVQVNISFAGPATAVELAPTFTG